MGNSTKGSVEEDDPENFEETLLKDQATFFDFRNVCSSSHTEWSSAKLSSENL